MSLLFGFCNLGCYNIITLLFWPLISVNSKFFVLAHTGSPPCCERGNAANGCSVLSDHSSGRINVSPHLCTLLPASHSPAPGAQGYRSGPSLLPYILVYVIWQVVVVHLPCGPEGKNWGPSKSIPGRERSSASSGLLSLEVFLTFLFMGSSYSKNSIYLPQFIFQYLKFSKVIQNKHCRKCLRMVIVILIF